MLHLTFTGVHAGHPICDQARQPGDEGVHMVYAPLDNPEFRAKVCPECIKAYVGSFDAEELAGLPEDNWVKQAALKPNDNQQELFA
jgi:hypothetical protein